MAILQIRPSSSTVNCGFCHRGLLRGERSDEYHLGIQTRVVCELCQPTALRAGWRRERLPDQQVPERSPERSGLVDRWRSRASHPERDRGTRTSPEAPSGRIVAEPRGPGGRARAALEHFNRTSHTSTISSVAHSLGEPTVTVVDAGDDGVDLVAAWELCWYRWRVEMGHGGVSVVELGRGYEMSELEAAELTGNATADSNGALSLLP